MFGYKDTYLNSFFFIAVLRSMCSWIYLILLCNLLFILYVGKKETDIAELFWGQ